MAPFMPNIDAIIDAADGIMIARGDIGVAIALVFSYDSQNLMILKILSQ